MTDTDNLYQYALNNPFCHFDPYGESLGGFLLGVGEMCVGAAVVASAVALEIVTVVGYTVGFTLQTSAGIALMSHGASVAAYNASDLNAGDSRTSRQYTTEREYWQQVHNRKKAGRVEPNPVSIDDLKNDEDWVEVTHPGQEDKHQEFENKSTGEKIRFDKGQPGKPGHGEHDHYHRSKPTPDPQGGYNYFDEQGNMVPRGSDASHLYLPENVWWQ